ncbi:MAG: hypothetical protein ACYC4R_10935 [Anaerolineae bacterium]
MTPTTIPAASHHTPRLRSQSLLADPLLWIGLGLLVLYLALVSLFPQGIFWSVDEGSKLIYMESVRQTGMASAPLVYPGRGLDPNLEFAPLMYKVVRDGEIYSWWPVGFPLLTLPLYMLVGWGGLFLLPALSGALTAVLSGALLRTLRPKPRWLPTTGALLVGLGTPVAFYATRFWEHAPATFLLMLALYLIVSAPTEEDAPDARLALAGIAASLSAFLRIEMALLALGMGLALLLLRPRWAVVFGVAFSLVACLWLGLNRAIMGDWLGPSPAAFTANETGEGLGHLGAWLVPYLLFNGEAADSLPIPHAMLAVGTLCALLAAVAPFLGKRWWIGLPGYLGVLALCIWALLYPVSYRAVHGFLLIAPHVLMGAWAVAGRARWRLHAQGPRALFVPLLSGGVAVFSVVYVLRAYAVVGGLQWGPRYMLALYPLLVVASLWGIAEAWQALRPGGRTLLAGLYLAGVLVGIGFEARGLATAQRLTTYYDCTRAAILELEERPMVSYCGWFPMVAPQLYWERRIYNLQPLGLEGWRLTSGARGFSGPYFQIEVDACAATNTFSDVIASRSTDPSGLIVFDLR